MKRIVFALCLASSVTSVYGEEKPQPANIVVLDICSARADHWGVYGYSRNTTPAIDGLAKDSVVFDRAIAQSSWCLPNYASLFTGHTPEVHGQYTNTPHGLPAFETTLAQKLKKAGYATAAFAGGVYMLPIWGLNRGFDHYVDRISTSSALPASFEKTMPEAEDWISARRDKPFFAYISIDDLHAPYQSKNPDKYDPGYEGIVHDTDTLNVRFFRAYNGEPLDPGNPLAPKLEAFRKDPRSLTHLAAHYDASINQVDDEVAEFVQRLKDLGLWENTVVVITADHGELLGEHGLLGHTQGLYEPILHVPLIVHFPKSSGWNGRRVPELIERVDLTPTLLDVAGQSYQEQELQGQSVLPLLSTPGAPWREYAYASSKRNLSSGGDQIIDERVVRSKRWKLHWYLYKNRFELYDLDADPMEEHDVSRLHPDVLQTLSFEMLKQTELSRPHAPGLPSGKTEPSLENNSVLQISDQSH